MSANIWLPTGTTRRKGQTDVVSPEPVDKLLHATLTMENFESNSNQTTHLANNSIEAKQVAEAAHTKTVNSERACKEQGKEQTRKAQLKKNLKEKGGEQEEEELLEFEAKKARITQAEEGQLKADDTVQTPSPANESQEPEDGEASQPGNVSSPPSPLLTARVIENFNEVAYPEGIKSPKVELNVNVRDGRFRYDREFLLQFMNICKLKPPTLLPNLGALGIEPIDQSSFAVARGSGGRHCNASGAMPVSANRQASVVLGIGGFQKSSIPSGFRMGNFQSPGSKLTSEERFAMSNPRSASTSSATSQFRSPMVRTPSTGGPGHPMHGSNRIRSKRGEKRGDANKAPMSQQEHGSGYGGAPILGAGFEPVVPLELSANRWVPASSTRKVQPDVDSPELVDRKVKALLNKLTMEKFETISDQIIHWANKSVNEDNRQTLVQVIRLVFEHATNEPAWSEMYARLCRKIMDQINPRTQGNGIIAGSSLFQKYLLSRCQEDFKRGYQWFAKGAAAAATALKSSNNQAIEVAHAKKGTEEAELHPDEYYYAAREAKRQYLGLIKFISELFKLQMLTERIMHEYVRKLLGDVGNPEEEAIGSLCQLLKTVGQLLDTPKARAHMNVYFAHMEELGKSHNASLRVQFMLQDVSELRDRRWVGRSVAAAPIAFAAVYEATTYRYLRISRGGRRLGSERNHEDVPDSGADTGGSGARTPSKDVSQFGKINNDAPIASVIGPKSMFAGSKKDGKRETPPRTNLSSVIPDTSNIAPISGASSGPIAPLKLSANRWIPASRTLNIQPDVDSPELVDRKVKALLNKLTMQRFDLISEQIIHWVNKSVNKDGQTLIQVIRLVFEHAINGAAWSKMYARLCRKMMEQISLEVQDDGINNAEGKRIADDQLFRKYFLRLCQDNIDRWWLWGEAAPTARMNKVVNEQKGSEEAAANVYYAAQKAKRPGLGLATFLGELFKRQIITESIIHECVKNLLCNVKDPEEEELESLCRLLQMVGQLLDTRKARAQMNVYFTRMKELSKGLNVSFRMQFMLQDVIELRDHKWIRRSAVAAPTTIVTVCEATPRSPAFPGSALNVQTQSRPGVDVHSFLPSMHTIQQPSSTPSVRKSPTPLPSQSAWVKGAPQSSSSSFAPLTANFHSRRPSALGQGVSIRDGVSVPRNNVGSVVRPGSVVFGSIDDTSAPLSSSPSKLPTVNAGVVRSFGSVPATSSGFADGKTLASASATASATQPSKPSSSSVQVSFPKQPRRRPRMHSDCPVEQDRSEST